MEPSELLTSLASTLEALEIPYFVTGSTASIAYGEPRFTNDIDIVVDLPASKVGIFCAAFPSPEYYVSESAAREAVSRRHQFNIIHPGSGLKIDVMVSKDSDFDRARFQRCRRLAIGPAVEVCFASPEDVILKKLQFHREGGSEKHLRDITSMCKISGDQLDRDYLARWARKLGVDATWEAIARQQWP
jgi:hypothetical protein